MIVEVGVFAAGAAVVVLTVLSAVRTVVLPHGRSSLLTRALFQTVRRVLTVHRFVPGGHRVSDRLMALYAPVSLMMLPIVWLASALVGFTGMFWALGTRPLIDAYKLAGSSLLTLGFSNVDDLPRITLSFVAAALAISVLALLLVTYLPSMYQAYSRRETLLAEFETQAGEPPSPTELLIRYHRIGATDRLVEVWTDWRAWFYEAGETHTALPAVAFFRSSSPERSWVGASEALLDAAGLWISTCSSENEPDASLCIRSGALALNAIAEFFRFEMPTEPRPDDPISVSRAEFDAMLEKLTEAGLCPAADRDRAWRDWSGWRVNYDAAVVALHGLLNPKTG